MKKALAVILLSAAVLSLPAGCGKNLTPASPAPPSQVLSYSLDHFFGQSGSITMDGPIGVGISGNTLWVANFFGQNLEAWTLSGVGSLQFSSFNSGVTFDDPYGVTVGPDGFIYVTEELHYLVDEFSPDGAYVTNIPQPGTSTSDDRQCLFHGFPTVLKIRLVVIMVFGTGEGLNSSYKQRLHSGGRR